MGLRFSHIAIGIAACLTLQPGHGQVRICDYSVNTDFNKARVVQEDLGEVLVVPVLVHVVYANTAQNISSGQIKSQLRVVNADFQRRNADTVNTLEAFEAVAANANIRFVLFTPDGISTDEPGVLRVASDHPPFLNSDLQYSTLGGSDAIAPSQVLNIWVADLGGDIFAYSKDQPWFPEEQSGIVIDFQHFGTEGTATSPFRGGRTLTHEIGHWLGLTHPWGDEGCGDGDSLDDTPLQDAPAYGCDLNRATCGSLDMVQNFMNLSDDACLNLFTSQQVQVMRQTLLGDKAGLINHGFVLKAPKEAPGVSLYPNPAISTFCIESEQQIDQIEIADSSGKNVRFTAAKHGSRVEISPVYDQGGMLFLSLKTPQGNIEKRVILKH